MCIYIYIYLEPEKQKTKNTKLYIYSFIYIYIVIYSYIYIYLEIPINVETTSRALGIQYDNHFNYCWHSTLPAQNVLELYSPHPTCNERVQDRKPSYFPVLHSL